jgi:hypothetical protein
MDQPKPYRSFTRWVLTTQLPFLLLHHGLTAYAAVVLLLEPIAELGWAIAVWALVLGSAMLFWVGNHRYYRRRLLPFMQRRSNAE